MDPLVAVIDRETDFLLRQRDNRSFLIGVEQFLEALQDEPAVVAHLEEMLQDLAGVVDVMERVDAELTSELVELRRELGELRPELDDRAEAVSDSGAGSAVPKGCQTTLASFDELAREEPDPFRADGRGGRAGRLLAILQSTDAAPRLERVASGGGGPASDLLEMWRRRLWNVQSRYDHAVRSMRLRLDTSPGLALLKLEAVPAAINPPSVLLDAEDDSLAAADELLRWGHSEAYSLFQAVWGGQRRNAEIDGRVAELRDGVDRLREDLHRRTVSAGSNKLATNPRTSRRAPAQIASSDAGARSVADPAVPRGLPLSPRSRRES